MNVDCLIVGAGQAGLSLAALLKEKGIDTLVLERDKQVGDVWRRRPDSMMLFTNRKMDSLPGLTLPGATEGFPDKNEIADYLEKYVLYHGIEVLTGKNACEVNYEDKTYILKTTDGQVYKTKCLINATGANQKVNIPEMARRLPPEVIQLAGNEYLNPSQFKLTPKVAIIGDGASGRQTAQELSASVDVRLFCGKKRIMLPGSLLGYDIFSWLTTSRVLDADTHSLVGRILKYRNPIPCNNIRDPILTKSGVNLVPALIDIKDNMLIAADGSTHKVDAVIWCLGYKDETDWLTLPDAVNDDGFICQCGHQNGGKTPYPGLFIVGRKWLSSRNSELIGGSVTDTRRVAGWVSDYLQDKNG